MGAVTKGTGAFDYYVFNTSDDNGFVIVSGEDRVRPVLGYSTESSFTMSDLPENLISWLEGYQKEIKYVEENGLEASAAIKSEWASYLNGQSMTSDYEEAVVLKTAKWHQFAPFNNECPIKEGKGL